MADVDIYWIARSTDGSVVTFGVTDPGLVTVSGQPVFEQDEDPEQHLAKVLPFIDQLPEADQDEEVEAEDDDGRDGLIRRGDTLILRRGLDEIEIDKKEKKAKRRKRRIEARVKARVEARMALRVEQKAARESRREERRKQNKEDRVAERQADRRAARRVGRTTG